MNLKSDLPLIKRNRCSIIITVELKRRMKPVFDVKAKVSKKIEQCVYTNKNEEREHLKGK
jgi:hypothetical protein